MRTTEISKKFIFSAAAFFAGLGMGSVIHADAVQASRNTSNPVAAQSSTVRQSQVAVPLGQHQSVKASGQTTQPVAAKSVSRVPVQQAATNTASGDTQIQISGADFNKYMHVNGSASYNSANDTVTLTPDQDQQAGHAAINVQIDMDRDFSVKAHVFLGNNPSNKGGADGIAVGFHPGSVNEVGQPGNAFGLGGIAHAFGFKLDTFYNSEGPSSSENANADPQQFSGPGDAFGGFIYSDANGAVSTYDPSNNSASPALIPSPNGQWAWLTMKYDGTTHVMTVNYQEGNYNHTWTMDVSQWITSRYMAFVVSSSTGSYKNLQQMNFFNITAWVPNSQLSQYKETVQVKYVNELTGQEIAPAQTINTYDGAQYTTTQQTIPHYTYDKLGTGSAPAAGMCTGAGMVVTYDYMPNAEHAVVNYVDGQTGKTVTSATVNGHYDETVTYNPQETEQGLEKQGYVIGTSTLPANDQITFSQDGTVPTYTVTLHHRLTTDTVSDNPDNVAWLSKTVTETINYRYGSATGAVAAPTKAQRVTFTRTATKDQVTGQVTYGAWSPAATESLPAVPTPPITGYTPDISQVAAQTVTPTTADTTTTVVYTPNPEKATVTYVDTTTGKPLRVVSVTGKYGETVPYDSGAIVKQLENEGYTYQSTTIPAAGIPLTTDGKTVNYVVDMGHLVTTDTTTNNPDNVADLQRTVTRTVKYQYTNGQPAAAANTTTLTFTRTAQVDHVTKQVTYGPWTATAGTTFPAVSSPVITGYTPDQATLPAITNVTATTPATTQTVTYAPNAESATVAYVDDTTGATLKTVTLHGKFDQPASYRPDQTITGYTQKGYALVSNDYPTDGAVFTTDGVVHHYVIHLRETTTTFTPNNNPRHLTLTHKVTRTVKFIGPDGKQFERPVVQTITFHRTATLNNVTGKITYGPWQPVGTPVFGQVRVPTVVGIDPSPAVVPAESGVTATTPDHTVTIKYTPNPEKVTVTYIDETTGKKLSAVTVTGPYGSTSLYTPKATIEKYEHEGYKVVRDDVPAAGIQFNEDGKIKHFVVGLTETTTTYTPTDNPRNLTLTHVVTRTIRLVGPNGRELAPAITQKVTFGRTATINNVTGKITYGPWHVIGTATFSAVRVPAIAGMIPEMTTVAALTGITLTTPNQTVTVVYHPRPVSPVAYRMTTALPLSGKAREVREQANSSSHRQQLPDTGDAVAGQASGIAVLALAVLLATVGSIPDKRTKRH